MQVFINTPNIHNQARFDKYKKQLISCFLCGYMNFLRIFASYLQASCELLTSFLRASCTFLASEGHGTSSSMP